MSETIQDIAQQHRMSVKDYLAWRTALREDYRATFASVRRPVTPLGWGWMHALLERGDRVPIKTENAHAYWLNREREREALNAAST